MAQVGSLYTSLTLESSSFISNMKKAADAADRGAGQIDKAFGVLKGAAAGLVAGIGIDAIVGVVNRGLEYASSLGEVSQQLGVTTKDLQVFRYAATQVGIDQETMDKGLAKLTKTLGDAKLGSTSATAAFGQLGISQAQIAKLDTGEAIRLIAERLAKIEDPAKRAAIEVDLFGKAGQKLDTLLAGGRNAVDELATAAERLGVVLSDENIQKADETADKLSAMKTVLQAKIATTVAENADSILYLADAVFNLTDAMLKGLPAAGRYYAGLAKIYKEDGIFAGLKETFFGTPESNQNTMARGADGSFRMKGVTGAGSVEALDARNAARPDRLVLGGGKSSRSRSSAGSKTPEDIYKGLSASDVRMGGLDTLNDVLGRDGGLSQGMTDAIDKAQAFGQSLGEITKQAVDLSNVQIINPSMIQAGQKFGEDLSRNLGQAIVFGQSLGDALVSSIKAAAAELVTSGLLDLLSGGNKGGGGFFGGLFSAVGAIFGGARAAGGPVQPGLAYLVGEKGPEMFMPNTGGNIMTADATRKVAGMASGAGRSQQEVKLSVGLEPSPLFVATVRRVTQETSAATVGAALKANRRFGLAGAMG